jgi:ElaB/YqjD/DUF883 family membrane-anchored ribosome-binding protein
MKFQTGTFSKKTEEIARDLRNLISEAEEILRGDNLSRHSENAIAGLRKQFRTAQDELAHVYDDTRRKVASGAKSADVAIRANPYQSLAMVFGIGLVAGIMLGRISKE